jgi:hypothetical protein
LKRIQHFAHKAMAFIGRVVRVVKLLGYAI